MATLAGLLAKLGPAATPAIATGLVVAWTVGDRRVSVLGSTFPVNAYDAALAAGLTVGDTALVLGVGHTITVLAKLASA